MTPQQEALLDHLQSGNTITSLEAYGKLGITQLATRVSELKDLGYRIDGPMIEVKTRYGKTTRVKEYRLFPKQAEQSSLFGKPKQPAGVQGDIPKPYNR